MVWNWFKQDRVTQSSVMPVFLLVLLLSALVWMVIVVPLLVVVEPISVEVVVVLEPVILLTTTALILVESTPVLSTVVRTRRPRTRGSPSEILWRTPVWVEWWLVVAFLTYRPFVPIVIIPLRLVWRISASTSLLRKRPFVILVRLIIVMILLRAARSHFGKWLINKVPHILVSYLILFPLWLTLHCNLTRVSYLALILVILFLLIICFFISIGERTLGFKLRLVRIVPRQGVHILVVPT